MYVKKGNHKNTYMHTVVLFNSHSLLFQGKALQAICLHTFFCFIKVYTLFDMEDLHWRYSVLYMWSYVFNYDKKGF